MSDHVVDGEADRRCGGTGMVAYWDGSAYAGEMCRGCVDCEPTDDEHCESEIADLQRQLTEAQAKTQTLDQDYTCDLECRLDPCEELGRLLEEAGAVLKIGLEAQGHLPTIERMLDAGNGWTAISRAIGWSKDAAIEAYAEVVRQQRAALQRQLVVDLEPVAKRLAEIRLLDNGHDGFTEGRWEEMRDWYLKFKDDPDSISARYSVPAKAYEGARVCAEVWGLTVAEQDAK